MAKSRRSYKGAAVANTLDGSIAATDFSINLKDNMSGWSTDGTPFFVVIDPGTAKEEKVCVKYSSAKVLTVVDPLATSGWTGSVNGRGVDDTTAFAHGAGAVIYPVFTALEANQANELVSKYTTNGDIVVHGSSTVKTISTGGSGANNKVLMADSTVSDGGVKWALIGSGSIEDGAIVDADINASAAIALSKLGTGALPTSITVASANLVDLTIDTADLKDGSVTSAKIADGAIVNADVNASAAIAYSKLALSNSIVAGDLTSASVTNAKLNNGSSGDVPLVTVSTDDPTGGKNGDIWVKVPSV